MRLDSLKRIATPLALVLAVALVAVVIGPDVAFARPGGGESYGGGGDSGGGGGGGVDPGLVLNLILFAFEHPILAMILAAIFAAVHFGNKLAGGVDVDVGAVGRVQTEASRSARRADLERLKQDDPQFSTIVFEDFLHLLYGELQRARARGQVDRIGPYAADEVRAAAASDPTIDGIEGVVLGAMRYVAIRTAGDANEVELEVEANLGEVRSGRETRFYVVDRVTLRRRRGARSRPPSRLEKLGCPNCGAPIDSVRGNQCSHCKQHVGDARFDWIVSRINRLRSETRPPLLTGEVEERGTDLPTIIDPRTNAGLAALSSRDPAFSADAFRARVGLVFTELNTAWSAGSLARARAFVGDSLFESFEYWIDVYRGAKARNMIEDATILRVDLANVTADVHFDAITVRLFAKGKDYVVTEDGRVLKGHRYTMRAWSEYWTFVKGHVAGRATRTDASCPNCGGPISVDIRGTCTFCKARITSGDFDWVLTRIEQDEAYRG